MFVIAAKNKINEQCFYAVDLSSGMPYMTGNINSFYIFSSYTDATNASYSIPDYLVQDHDDFDIFQISLASIGAQ